MASEKINDNSDSSSEDTTIDRESEKFNDGIGRSYECNFCKRGFTNAQALGGHMNIHRKDKLKAKQNNQESSTKSSKEANYVFDNSRYNNNNNNNNYAPISSHDELQHHDHYSRAQMNSYQFHFQLPQNPSYNQHVYNQHHDGSRTRHENYYDGNNLSLRIGSTLIDDDDDEEGGGKKDVDESELDLELRLGYSNH